MTKKDKTMIFRYDSSIGDELNYLCEVLGLTRSEVVRCCIDRIYTVTYLHDKFGLTDDEVARCCLGKKS